MPENYNINGRSYKKNQKFYEKDAFFVVTLILVAVIIRVIPEIKAGIWPIGYDTFNTYVADLMAYQGSLINWLKTANILYFLFLPFKLLGVHPYLIMKIFGALLYAGLVTSFYYFARKNLKFTVWSSFVLGFFLIFQFGALRISWDLFRNEFALIFLFVALINLGKVEQRRNFVYFIVSGLLIVFSNQLVTVLLGVSILAFFFSRIRSKNYQAATKIILPGLLFLLGFLLVINTSGTVLFNPNVFFSSEQNYFGFYFYHYRKLMSYGQLATTVFQLFALVFSCVLLPFAVYGFWALRKNVVLTALTLWLLAGTFSSLVFAGIGLIVWDRWLYMLVFPFSIYSIYAITVLGQYLASRVHLKLSSVFSATLALLFWIIFMSFFVRHSIPFLTASAKDAKPPLLNDPLNSYFPKTMVHNSIGMWKIDGTLDAIQWLDAQAPAGSAVIVDNRYRGPVLTNFDLSNRYIITNSWSETLQNNSLDLARAQNFSPIYLIWSTSKSIDNFDRIYNSGDTGIYEYLPIKNSVKKAKKN